MPGPGKIRENCTESRKVLLRKLAEPWAPDTWLEPRAAVSILNLMTYAQKSPESNNAIPSKEGD